jgi:flavin-binding protein dodecin
MFSVRANGELLADRRAKEHAMGEVSDGVVKVIELVGSSPRSFSDAVRNAVKVASETVRHIKGVDVLSSTAEVDEQGELTTYKVHCKIAFLVERTVDQPTAEEAQAAVAASSAGAAGARGVSPGARG